MKSCLAFVATLSLLWVAAARADVPDDRYVEIYSLIEDADKLTGAGEARLAAEKYSEARNALKEFQQAHPSWNPKLVSFRLEYVSSRLNALPAGGALPAAVTATNARPALAVGDPAAVEQLQRLTNDLARLASQNALLEARLREALSVQPAAADPRELAKAEEKVKQLQKEKELLLVALEQERAKGVRPAVAPALPDKTKQLEEELRAALTSATSAQALAKTAQSERDELARKLEKANKDLSKRNGRPAKENSQDGERLLENAQARLLVYEAKPVPLTAEEMAMVKQPPIKVAEAAVAAQTNVPPARQKTYEIPPGAGPLVTAAERAIDAGRYDEAEKKLRDVLRQDENNVMILAKLGAAQMDQDKLSEAEATLKKALAVDPDHAVSLYLLGGLKLRQEKYDEALDALSRSVKIFPDNAQTQYFLGKTLIQKGTRAPAETALRRAIQIKPGWGEPHYLLAVIYGTQEPNYRELARFHYKKAIAGGAARNLELEKRIENGASSVK